MQRLCFGGSFNPIHHGHLICARAVAEAAGYDRVVLIPSAQPPHKPNHAELARPEDRLAMTRLAAGCQPELFEVNDVELQRPGRSYTIDTVRILKEQGWDRVDWLIGADMLRLLPKWHQPEALLREVNFVIIARPGWSFDWSSLPPAYRALEKNVHAAPQIDISATDIRQRIAAGRSIEFLTPPAVVEYIRARGLYRSLGENKC
ncbi:MAG TPA: nicotinate (nicotinamide) nucleotide adenylyltransferase [Tepidisphaeraceae bacterium]|nr:nicotinate (nicotinamide) nucleotide adenylyltransferase [Tepidisphaeraceae bacterium]